MDDRVLSIGGKEIGERFGRRDQSDNKRVCRLQASIVSLLDTIDDVKQLGVT